MVLEDDVPICGSFVFVLKWSTFDTDTFFNIIHVWPLVI